MAKRILIILAFPAFLFAVSGCATNKVNKDAELEIQGLKNQVALLENQVQSKDAEITGLKGGMTVSSSETASTLSSAAQSDQAAALKKPSAKDIQTALKNAGYYQGNVDGKMGRLTRQAVKAFQKANNLKADGRVGKKTWSVLNKYLSQENTVKA